MTIRTLTLAAAVMAATGAAHADDHGDLMGYALAGDGMTLVTMASIADPGAIETHELANRLDAIAYRPVTGDLLGFSREGMIYSVDPLSGTVTDLGASFADDAMISGAAVAFDFNNAIDAVRLVGSDGANLVYFPADFGDEKAGKVIRFTDAYYGEGDANAGTEPLIYANAYTNAVEGAKAGSTAQYALDARTNALVSLANNDGTLATIGAVTVDGEPVDLVSGGGFDIYSPQEGTDEAYAILQIDGSGTSGLYSIDLDTAEATLLADLGMVGISGFAVSQSGM
ncbi:DUF4394 domain-containing protein [Acuticoccus sp. M5D2P5]|uniref:DUF4394 domain-containing protein n=1 Tax=Acuticoccus kalidii TaxID=2910977 RepID=UPI001F2EAA50|nr:DUF4394 domain-containing protein [Acuticoccus kalidii]MCF3935400.1 DUF4394 domain-containing protein [Acuticoccus kalidii]